MSFLQKLFGSSGSQSSPHLYSFKVRCSRCGEILEGRVDLFNDLSVVYEDAGDGYFVRKSLMGNGRCFQRLEVELKFNSARELQDRQVQGGTFVEGG